jgi:tetratricopeptide (TPR) repeat protein/TolB-like protein
MPARVVVGVFKNESANSTLDVLGEIATDWLTDGLQRIEGIEVVPAKFALSLGSRPVNVRELAEATGAGTVVSGVYYDRSDSLVFHAQIVDARNGRLMHSLDPVVGSEQRPMDVIDSLRQRVLGALALHFGAPGHVAEKGGSPPTFAAYQNYLAGVRGANEFRYRDAIRHLDAALALDSTFLGAWFTKADVHYNLAALTAATGGLSDPEVGSQFAAGDFAWRLLQDARGRMSPAQRHFLDWAGATRRGDLSGALRAVRRMVAVAPDPGSRSLEALSAVRINRFQEAIEVSRAAGLPDWGWAVSAEAFHMLGNHRRELSEARRARQRHPDLHLTLALELRALAALGRAQEVKDLLDEAFSLAPQPGWWTHGSLAAVAGLELGAHGYPEAAKEVLQRSIDWYRTTTSVPNVSRLHRYGLARGLYWAGHWQEARLLFAQLLAEAPSDLDYLGYWGVARAREGNRAEALRISGQIVAFVRPYPLFGQPTLWRARIAAVLGERDEAVSLVREAITQGLLPLDVAQGFGYAMLLHCDTDFGELRDYPPFKAIVVARK